jgi:hypothetical protein
MNSIREDIDGTSNNNSTSNAGTGCGSTGTTLCAGLLAHWKSFGAGSVTLTFDTNNISEADKWITYEIGK